MVEIQVRLYTQHESISNAIVKDPTSFVRQSGIANRAPAPAPDPDRHLACEKDGRGRRQDIGNTLEMFQVAWGECKRAFYIATQSMQDNG